MVDREKRRKRIKKWLRFFDRYGLTIAITISALVIITMVAILYAVVYSPVNHNADVSEETYSDIFEKDEQGNIKKNNKKKKTEENSSDNGEEEVEEYSTILKYNADTKPGYMNNCIFLGDSRTVAMVSYGFVSDENVLAKVGISHPAVMNSTFTQNSGKEYTVSQYLESHKAPVVYLAFGVNGMNGISEEKYEKTYKDMVEAIIEKAPDSEIVLMAIGPVDDYGSYKKSVQNAWINKYNEFLITLAEYEGIYYLDIDSVLKGEDGQVKPEYDAGDGLHYRACAYTVMLDYIIHHPVVGIPDDGDFVVKYVKPTGQFKKMMKETTSLPANAQVADDKAIPTEDAKDKLLISPSPTVSPTVIPTPSPVAPTKEKPKPSPTLSPSPTIPVVTPSPTPKPTIPVEEPVIEPTPVPTDPPGVTETPPPSDDDENNEEPEITPEPKPTPTEPVEEPVEDGSTEE